MTNGKKLASQAVAGVGSHREVSNACSFDLRDEALGRAAERAGATVNGPRSPWVVGAKPREGLRLRLFCFPHAGGTASVFSRWGGASPPDVEVCPIQLPGRSSRFREEPCTSSEELVRAAAEGLGPLLDVPFALFGHSMGGLIAFEFARELRRRARRGPVFLAVSGCPAPQRSGSRVAPLAHLNDAEFLEQVRLRYSAIPEEVLAQPELVELLLPALRADMRIVETYSCEPEPPLECPIRCFGGTTDHTVPREDLEAWSEQTRGSFSLREFPGGHFFLFDAPDEVLGALREELRGWVPAS